MQNGYPLNSSLEQNAISLHHHPTRHGANR